MAINKNGSVVTQTANATSAAAVSASDTDRAIARTIRRHLLPFLFVLYVIAYLDRINIGFAALTMNHELGLSSQQYGLLTGIFFWGYFYSKCQAT
jgi:sugar phosphate permease